MSAPRLSLTVLICTHDRSALLARTLRFLNAARCPDDMDVQVLVVANACRDDTLDLLARMPNETPDALPLSWIVEERPGKSHALNRAVPQLATDLVAFVDDDHRVDDGYLVGVAAAARAYPDADLFCGRILPDWDGTEPRWVHDQGPYRIVPLPVPWWDLGPVPRNLKAEDRTPGGGNLIVRRAWLARAGPFATDLGPVGHDLGGAEDMDWILRALNLGARLQYVPDVVQHHYVDTARLTVPYLMRKAYARSATSIRLLHDRPASRMVPLYTFRKLATYAGSAIATLDPDRRRFFLVRIASILGEMRGHAAWARNAETKARLGAVPVPARKDD